MNDLISIIIPCFNDAKYIEQSVNSALSQTYSSKEIIIVDDGSNFETKQILQKLELKIDLLITQENMGQSVARNNGISKANGEFVFVLDSDDFADPTYCEEAIKIFNSENDAVIVTTQAKFIFPSKEELYIPKGGQLNNFLLENCALGTSFFRKRSWEKVGGYDEEMRNGFEDWEFFIRLLQFGGKAVVIQKPLYNYRIRNNSTNHRANKIKYQLWRYIYLKHKALYKDNFEDFIDFLLEKLSKEELDRIKIFATKDYKLGSKILFPFRFIKSLIG